MEKAAFEMTIKPSDLQQGDVVLATLLRLPVYGGAAKGATERKYKKTLTVREVYPDMALFNVKGSRMLLRWDKGTTEMRGEDGAKRPVRFEIHDLALKGGKKAATYVQISRDEFEEWLTSTGYKWERDRTKAGIYHALLSPHVAILISSTIGTRDDAMDRGRAAMQMRLISRVTGQTLNKKAQGQSHFKRTKGWKTTWKKGLDGFNDVYKKAQAWYDKLASIEDREKYKNEWIDVIESTPGWESNRFLQDLRERLVKGGILTEKQELALKRQRPAPSRETPSQEAPSAPSGAVDDALLNQLRQLWKAAKPRADRGDRDADWTLGFAKSMGEKVKRGRPLSPNELRKVQEKFRRYRVASLLKGAFKRVAAQFLSAGK